MEVDLEEKLTDAEMFDLGKTRSVEEWGEVCDRIKAARGGYYPREWFTRIVLSKFMNEVQVTWRKS